MAGERTTEEADSELRAASCERLPTRRATARLSGGNLSLTSLLSMQATGCQEGLDRLHTTIANSYPTSISGSCAGDLVAPHRVPPLSADRVRKSSRHPSRTRREGKVLAQRLQLLLRSAATRCSLAATMQASTSAAASSSTPPTTDSAASTAPAPPQGTAADAAATNTAADQKRAFRAAKKAEQERRKEERKKFAQETGVDPALLPKAIAGDLAHHGQVKPKGFVPREWIDVPLREGVEESGAGRNVSIVTWNVSRGSSTAAIFLKRPHLCSPHDD